MKSLRRRDTNNFNFSSSMQWISSHTRIMSSSQSSTTSKLSVFAPLTSFIFFMDNLSIASLSCLGCPLIVPLQIPSINCATSAKVIAWASTTSKGISFTVCLLLRLVMSIPPLSFSYRDVMSLTRYGTETSRILFTTYSHHDSKIFFGSEKVEVIEH